MDPTNDLYKTLFRQSKDAVFMVQSNGYIRETNQALLDLLGHTAQSMRTLKMADLIEDEATLVDLISALQREGSVHDYLLRLCHHDGHTIEAQLTISITYDESGYIDNYLGILRDVTKQKQTVKNLIERQEILESFNIVSQEIAPLLDPQEILQTVCRRVVNLFGITSGVISDFDEAARSRTIIVEYFSKGAASKERQSHLGESEALPDFGKKIDEFKTQPFFFYEANTAELGGKESELLRKFHCQSLIRIPLLARGRLVGLMELGESRFRRDYSHKELELLQAIGSQTALAVDNARLYQQATAEIHERQVIESELSQQNETLEKLNQLSRDLAATLDSQELLTIIVQTAVSLFDITSAYISTYDEQGKEETVIAEYYGPEAKAQELVSVLGESYPLEPDDFDWAVGQFKAVAYFLEKVEDNNTLPGKKEHLLQYGARSVLGIPLHASGKLLGVMELWESRFDREFNENEIELALSVGQRAAIAIENARLYEQAKAEISEREQTEAILAETNQEIQAKAESIAIINRIADVLHRSLEFETVVNQATDLIMNYANAPAATLFRLAGKGSELTLLVAKGLPTDEMAIGTQIKVEESLSGTAVASRDIITSNELAQAETLNQTFQKIITEAGLHSLISIPLLYHEHVMGVINLFFVEELQFAVTESETLLSIGKTIALAMANAQYVTQVEEQIQERKRVENALREREESLRKEVKDRENLQRQVEEALVLRNRQLAISRLLAGAQTEQEIFKGIVNHVDHFPHVAVTLSLLLTQENTLVDLIVAQNGYDSGLTLLPNETERSHSELPLAQHYTADEPFLSPNVAQDERLPAPVQTALADKGFSSMAVLPLTAGGDWLGNLSLISREEDFFNEQTLSVYQTVAEQGAIALRASRLFMAAQTALARREREVAVSTQIAQEIASATDLDELYHRVVNQIQEQFGYYHTQLLRNDHAMETVVLTYGYGQVGDEMLALNHSVPIGVGLIGLAAASGRSVLRTNLSRDPNWQPNSLLAAAKGELAVPIKLGNEVLGILDVQSDHIDQLNENDQLILEGLCGQIAVAIESTTLRQDLETQLRELNILQRQMSREGWEEYQVTRQQAGGYQFDHGTIHDLAEPVTVAANGQSSNGQSHPEEEPEAANRSQISTPLTIRGEIIGHLGIHESAEQPLTPEEEDFLAAVSLEVADALEAARLFEQTQDALAEQERLTSELETVAQVSTAASTILEVDALLQSVVDLSKSSFNLYHVHIYLLSDTGRKLILKAGAGNVGRLMALEGREISIDANSIVARAARSRQGVLENNVRKTVDFLPHPLLPNTESEIAVPMIVGDKLIGVLDLQSDRVNNFALEDLNIHRTLASQVSIAVENARQYAEQVETSTKLRELDQLKSEFLASMSHELRTPLNSIIGFADVLLEGLDGDLNERMEEDVHLIRESGRHLRELIGEILDMSKIEAGRMELRYEDIDLRRLAEDVIATAQPLAAEKSLAMYLDISENVSILMADQTRLRQVLWNIMGNAIKFTETGSVSLSIQDEGDNVLFAIRDTGIGIKEENIGIVFEQFRQIDGGLNRVVGGTGLGMPITRKLVEIHGGEIWVESVYEQGSTFFFTLPYDVPIDKPATGLLPPLP